MRSEMCSSGFIIRQSKRAVKTTGRKKLIMMALWTKACLSFPTLDALGEEYEVYPVVDAVDGTSLLAHQSAMERVIQADAQPISWIQLLYACSGIDRVRRRPSRNRGQAMGSDGK